MTITTFTSDDARKRWRDILDLVYPDEAEVVIERYHKPVAVLINFDQYQVVKALLRELRTIRQAERNQRSCHLAPHRRV
jgi:PHD/YefM family antitoxin component YafN of YafNO toxin-antitoxin module